MKKYSGQAIAIIMIVLVVAVVIGGSLYSRVVRNKGEVVDTIDSQKALEQAGNVLDAFVAIDLSSLQNLISQQLKSSPNEEIILDNLSKINEFLLLLNSEDNLDLSLLDLGNDNLCSEPVVNITYEQLTDGIEYEVGIKKEESKTPIIKTKPLVQTTLERTNVTSRELKVEASVKAPIPGLVLKVNYKVGDLVKIGDSVVLLEAMKMQNDIQASKDGVIKEIKVYEGQNVLEGDVLVVIE